MVALLFFLSKKGKLSCGKKDKKDVWVAGTMITNICKSCVYISIYYWIHFVTFSFQGVWGSERWYCGGDEVQRERQWRGWSAKQTTCRTGEGKRSKVVLNCTYQNCLLYNKHLKKKQKTGDIIIVIQHNRCMYVNIYLFWPVLIKINKIISDHTTFDCILKYRNVSKW